MTQETFGGILAESGYPVAYLAFPADTCPEMPFITFQEIGSNNVSADGRVWQRVRIYQVDLFTRYKDPTAENALESAFDNNDLFWNKVQTLEETEACQRYTYTLEVLGG